MDRCNMCLTEGYTFYSICGDCHKQEISRFYDGKREAVKQYAWWKDGIEYVGCGVYTLKDALKRIDEEENMNRLEK